MKKLVLIKAIAVVLAGSALTLLSVEASATTMYNTYNAYASNIGTDSDVNYTDGWTYPEGNSPRSPSYGWVGTPGWSSTGGTNGGPGGGALPFGLTSHDVPVANWAVQLAGPATATVSSQNAHDLYGIWADIDTTKGAWNDRGQSGSSNSNGTIYNMDVGLFQSTQTQQITMSVSNIDPAGWQNFGINVYSGSNQMLSSSVYLHTADTCCDSNGQPIPAYTLQDTNLADFQHYGYWNRNYRPATDASPNTAPATVDNPFGSHGINYLTHGDQSTVSFTAEAGQVYAIILGGYSGEGMYSNHAGYAVNITSSPVPLPGAVVLFATAMAGLIGMGKRKMC